MTLTIDSFTSNAIELLPGDLSKGIILMCEHATSAIPEKYHNLGLPTEQLNRHIAYDIGAAQVTRKMSKVLGVPAILTKYSRLLIDPNRALNDPTLIMQLSDGAIIPGNAYISDQETRQRIETYYNPYHTALKKLIDNAIEAEKAPILISLHSFTDRWKQLLRPWEIGILWDKDPRLPNIFLRKLSEMLPMIAIGNNEPYSGRLIQDTMYSHATKRGLAHVLIELRQDLIRQTSGQQEWADHLSHIVDDILNNPKQFSNLHQPQDFGSYILTEPLK